MPDHPVKVPSMGIDISLDSGSAYCGQGDATNFWACNSEDVIANFNFSISIRAKTIAQKSGREVEL